MNLHSLFKLKAKMMKTMRKRKKRLKKIDSKERKKRRKRLKKKLLPPPLRLKLPKKHQQRVVVPRKLKLSMLTLIYLHLMTQMVKSSSQMSFTLTSLNTNPFSPSKTLSHTRCS